jgi:hypothetical protein
MAPSCPEFAPGNERSRPLTHGLQLYLTVFLTPMNRGKISQVFARNGLFPARRRWINPLCIYHDRRLRHANGFLTRHEAANCAQSRVFRLPQHFASCPVRGCAPGSCGAFRRLASQQAVSRSEGSRKLFERRCLLSDLRADANGGAPGSGKERLLFELDLSCSRSNSYTKPTSATAWRRRRWRRSAGRGRRSRRCGWWRRRKAPRPQGPPPNWPASECCPRRRSRRTYS